MKRLLFLLCLLLPGPLGPLGPVAAVVAADAAPRILVRSFSTVPVEAGASRLYQAEVWVGIDRLREEPMELQVREAGAAGFTTVRTTSTGYDGHQASVGLRLTRSAQLRWHHPATGRAGKVYSALIPIAVRSRVGAAVNDRTLRIGQRLVVRGRVAPAAPGRVVRLWAGTRGQRPIALGRARLSADGSYRITRRFAHPGLRKLFVTIGATTANVAGWSSYRYVRVR